MRNLLSVVSLSLFTLCISNMQAASASAAAPGAAPMKDWTMLVFMNGNNSLDSFTKTNLLQMEKVGSTDSVNVVVEWASMEAGNSRRLLVQKSTGGEDVTSPILSTVDHADMGDWHHLVDFVKWGVATYPAKHYFIDVWDHGAGWHSIQMMNTSRGKFHANDISWDENSGHFITTEQLGQAMAEAATAIGHKVDLYGSDACLMAMAEVAGEMTDSVSNFVGSQEVEPGAGWPYTEILTRWNAKAGATAADISKIMVEEYIAAYSGGSNGNSEVTFSAFDLTKTDALNTAITALGKKLGALDSGARAKVVSAMGSTQKFTDDDYEDLVDFITNIGASSIRGVEAQDLADVKTAANDFVIANGDTSQYSAHSHGLSMWIPASKSTYSQYSDRYKALKFNVATNWAATLESLLQDTR